ncbi:uncharacterized protein LOC124153306 [Ischnura elegans]|uniref:uncharacterized protein LOC124153306 n=1 Tax=Ischnura elegans TaxID=197161 RepID=UPI001ED8A28B|nr:uncharacterized protein LOC124153306 [Ischnura elegans]
MALKRAIGTRHRMTKETADPPIARACLPYISSVSGKISRILKRNNIQTIHKPPSKIRDILVEAKDPRGLKISGVYRVPCGCGKVYVGETARTIETRLKEHRRHLRLGQPEKSAIAEHSISCDNPIRFEETAVIARAYGYWDRLVKEAIEIRLEPNNFNRDSGFNLSSSWKPVLKTIRLTRDGKNQSERTMTQRDEADQSHGT